MLISKVDNKSFLNIEFWDKMSNIKAQNPLDILNQDDKKGKNNNNKSASKRVNYVNFLYF